MYGELTDKSTIEALNHALDNHIQDQFEILLYKKNRKPCYLHFFYFLSFFSFFETLLPYVKILPVDKYH